MLQAFASGAISWLLATLTASALVLGIGGVVYSRLPVLPYRTIVAIVASVLLFVAGWMAHASDQRGKQERADLLAANRALQIEIRAEQGKAQSLERDAKAAQVNAAAAEARAQEAEAVAATIPASGGLSADTSTKTRDLWGK